MSGDLLGVGWEGDWGCCYYTLLSLKGKRSSKILLAAKVLFRKMKQQYLMFMSDTFSLHFDLFHIHLLGKDHSSKLYAVCSLELS